MYLDIDYMNAYRDFTYDKNAFKNLPQLMSETIKDNIHWTFIIDAGIEADMKIDAFADGYKNDVFMKWPKSVPQSERQKGQNFPIDIPKDKDVYYGRVWPNGPAAFPDFFKNATIEWWVRQADKLHKELPFSAIWIVNTIL